MPGKYSQRGLNMHERSGFYLHKEAGLSTFAPLNKNDGRKYHIHND
jgi:hypothetical protein